MKKQFIKISLILLPLLFLLGCAEKMTEQGASKKNEVIYKEGLPKENSSAFTEFIRYYLTTNRGIFLLQQGNIAINTNKNVSSDEKMISYYKYSKEQLKSYYKPLLNAEDSKSSFTKLILSENADHDLYESIENQQEYNLPSITMEENNQVHIKTNMGEENISLSEVMKEYGVKNTDKLIFNLRAVNKEVFAIEIQDTSVEVEEGGNLYLGLFVKQDLTEYMVSSLHAADFQQTLETGKLDEYIEVFPKVDSEGSYSFLFGDTIVDTKTNQIIQIKEDDLLSKDGKYVYINGRKSDLKGGIQKIQTIGKYGSGTDINEVEFPLDFDVIAKKLELKTNGVSFANINYFNENYLVLGLNYTGIAVGTAGYTNVMIDLQDKQKPVAYLVDLGIE